MKNIYLKRFFATFISFIILTAQCALPLTALADDGFWNEDMHFVVRHWHAVSETGGGTGNEEEEDDEQHFTLIDGYIRQVSDTEHTLDITSIQVDGAAVSADEIDNYKSKYIKSFNETTGNIELNIVPLSGEKYAGTSISAGHKQITPPNMTGAGSDETGAGKVVTIEYDKYVHLTKCHIFYISKNDIKSATGLAEAFGENGIYSDKSDPYEYDTALLYVYDNDILENGVVVHSAGDIVTEASGTPIKAASIGDPWPATGTAVAHAKKVYNSQKGLHTDKTASKSEKYDGGRTFDLTLESWYSGVAPANVGMIFDASASMSFTSDDPDPISIYASDGKSPNPKLNLDADKLAKLEAKKLTESNKPTSNDDWNNKVFLTEDELNWLLDTHNTANSPLGVTGYSYYVYDNQDGSDTNPKEYVPLAYWDGKDYATPAPTLVPGTEPTQRPQPTPIGKYEFTSGGRLLNGATGNTYAKMVETATSVANSNTVNAYDFSAQSAATAPTSAYSFNNNRFAISQSTGAFVLDAKPSSGDFTISFTVNVDPRESSNTADVQDLLYVGPLSGDGSGSDFFRVVRREAGSRNRIRGTRGSSSVISNFNNIFSDTTVSTVIYVFYDGGAVKSYIYKNGFLPGDTASGTVNFTSDDYNIVFNGFTNSYDGGNMYVDDIYVFDSALTPDEIVKCIPNVGSKAPDDPNPDVGGTVSRTTYAGNQTVRAGDNRERIIGYVDDAYLNAANSFGGWFYVNGASNLDNDYYATGLESGKQLISIVANSISEFNDNNVELPANNPHELPSDGVNLTYKPTETTATKFYIDKYGYLRCFFSAGSNYAYKYTVSYVYEYDDSKYIKVESLQRAAGSFTTKLLDYSPSSKVSAVRFSARNSKNSQDYLNRLVMLDWTSSPYESTEMFSLKRGGGGTILGDTSTSYGLDQYNYGLTGGTYTWTGLQSYIDNLVPHQDNDADKYLIIFTDGKDNVLDYTSAIDSNKFGTTTSDSKYDNYGDNYYNPARDLARILRTPIDEQVKGKNDSPMYYDSKGNVVYSNTGNPVMGYGYTIYAAMLTGGPVKKGSDDYNTAVKYLTDLTGSQNRVFTTDQAMEDYEGQVTSSSDALVKIFEDRILNDIVKKLEHYTVQDYVDPRFDLVDKYGSQWHLNAKGIVKIGDDDTEYDLSKPKTGETTRANVRTDTDNDGVDDGKFYLRIYVDDEHQARLYYDDENDMYYLKWREQTIPGSAFGATEIQVWSSTVTVRAKDDFLGGNSVLTNGNAEKQNWVFSPEEWKDIENGDGANISSGTDDSKEASEHPSKGFPRTAVNVGPAEAKDEDDDLIYMGAELSLAEVIDKYIALTNQPNANLYFDYLYRYALENQSFATELANLFYKDGTTNAVKENVNYKGTFTIPYFYLPDAADQTNSTGTEYHKGDLIGYLTYEWNISDTPDYPSDGISKDTHDREATLSVTYTPKSVEDRATGAHAAVDSNGFVTTQDGDIPMEPSGEGDNEKLVRERQANGGGIYSWDGSYKPLVGDEQAKLPAVDGDFTKHIVSGEIVLQMKIDTDRFANYFENHPERGQKITYVAYLYREYTDEIGYHKEKIGTYTAEWTNGIDSPVQATLALETTFTAVYSDNGLPYGVYTLEFDKERSSDFLFSEIKPVEITAANKDLFGRDPNLRPVDPEYADEYAATTDTGTAYLGVTDKDQDPDTADTDARYALFEVEPQVPIELPETGGKGFNIAAILSGLLMLFTAGYIYSRKKKFIK